MLSRDNRTTVFLVHLSSPKGVPLIMHFLTAASSASVCSLLTSERHSRGSGFFKFCQPPRCVLFLLSRPDGTLLLFLGTFVEARKKETCPFFYPLMIKYYIQLLLKSYDGSLLYQELLESLEVSGDL